MPHTGAGTPTIFTNAKGHVIYEDPSTNSYYVVDKKGKRRSGVKAYGIRINGRRRLLTKNDANSVPAKIRRVRYTNNAYNSFSNNNTENVPVPVIPNTPVYNRELSKLYKFPFGEPSVAIRNVSQNVWKQFQAVKDGKETPSKAAWLILKSRGQTVGVQPYTAGFIMNKYNWKDLYSRSKNESERKVIRYILLMLALNPPFKNRKTGNRNMYVNNSVVRMSNSQFNSLLASTRPVNNQGQGLLKAFVRTTASGVTFAKTKAINHQHILVPLAATVIKAGLTGGASAGLAAGRTAAMSALKSGVISGVKSKFGNNPIASYMINEAAAVAENKIRAMRNPTNTDVRKIVANAATDISDEYIESKIQKARARIYSNIGPYAGNAYGTRNQRADKGAAAIREYLKSAMASGKNINTNTRVKTDIQQLINLAVRPRSNRPPLMSNMAWAAAGVLLITGASIPLASLVTQGVVQQGARAVIKTAAPRMGATGEGQRMAAEAAQRIAVKKAKSGQNLVKRLLNKAARGETISPNMINKAIVTSGGDPRVGLALEQGGSFARHLLESLA